MTHSRYSRSSFSQVSCSVLSDSATPWITAHQASLSITNCWSSLKLTSIESVMPSNHLILCHPLLLLSPIPPSIRVFSNESTLHMRWPKYWSFSFTISPSNEFSGLISFRMDWFDFPDQDLWPAIWSLYPTSKILHMQVRLLGLWVVWRDSLAVIIS